MILAGTHYPTHLALGPMAGFTDGGFRRLAREMGLELAFTEMISAKAVVYDNQETFSYAKSHESDHPLGLQIFGREPKTMAAAANILAERYPYEILDVNMGCPAKKIIRNGEGSALLKEPSLVFSIVETLVRLTDKPVSVKIRLGLNAEHKNALEIARIIESAGASFLTVHGRTSDQHYSGKADWESIGTIKSKLTIPVIGSGDIFTLDDAIEKKSLYGVDGLMVARGTIGNPFLIRDIALWFTLGEQPIEVSLIERIDTVKKHFRYMAEDKGESRAIVEFRSVAGKYFSGFRGSAAIRAKLSLAASAQELYDILAGLEE